MIKYVKTIIKSYRVLSNGYNDYSLSNYHYRGIKIVGIGNSLFYNGLMKASFSVCLILYLFLANYMEVTFNNSRRIIATS